jgi:hypothetical protein
MGISGHLWLKTSVNKGVFKQYIVNIPAAPNNSGPRA